MTETMMTLAERVKVCKALAFDFDGTLVDSNTIKRSAFDVCFAEYPEHLQAIRDYCYRFNHTPRWEKFQYVTETILKKPYTEAVAKELHRRYEEATTQQVIRAPEIPGALAFLRTLPKCPALLLSSTPDAIIKQIVKARQMDGFFMEIYGAPLDKTARLADYKKMHALQEHDILFFGDTSEDAASAQKAGWPFVAVANPALQHQGAFYIADYKGL